MYGAPQARDLGKCGGSIAPSQWTIDKEKLREAIHGQEWGKYGAKYGSKWWFQQHARTKTSFFSFVMTKGPFNPGRSEMRLITAGRFMAFQEREGAKDAPLGHLGMRRKFCEEFLKAGRDTVCNSPMNRGYSWNKSARWRGTKLYVERKRSLSRPGTPCPVHNFQHSRTIHEKTL